MIYSYIFIPHKVIKAQSFVNYIVLEILCKASKKGMPADFDENIVINKYKKLIQNINPDYIKIPINNAYQICKDPNNFHIIKLLKKTLHSNINIKGICDSKIKPVLYSDIKKTNKELANNISSFCTYLYTEVFKLKPCIDLYGEIRDHYVEFSIKNGLKNKRCPFCGIARMESEFSSKREAYDHFFPKEQYPFISVHFANLAPMCHSCNSSYKGRKNPIDVHKKGIHKKVFYPYFNYGKINFTIEINNIRLDSIQPNEINVINILNGYDEEIESWEDIFDIKERYKSIYAGGASSWFEEVRIATNNFGMTYKDYKDHLNVNYYIDENFMKLAFLEACETKGLINR